MLGGRAFPATRILPREGLTGGGEFVPSPTGGGRKTPGSVSCLNKPTLVTREGGGAQMSCAERIEEGQGKG